MEHTEHDDATTTTAESEAAPGGTALAPAGVLGSDTEHHVTRRTRTSAVWVALVASLVVLVLLLVFILENGQRVHVSFLGAHGALPLGVALLLAAVIGGLVVALSGAARILQIRARARRARALPAVVSQPGDVATGG